MSEHSGRYRHVAEALTAVGFACYGIDHRGHGLSGGRRAYIPDLQDAIVDLDLLYGIVRSQYPELPIFAFAHSMGSLIGLGFALRYPDRLRGLSTSGTPLHGERSRPSWTVSLLLCIARFIPRVRFSPPGEDSVLTRDEAILRDRQADPLIDKGMWRLGTTAAIVKMARHICARAASIRPPLLVMHGDADHLAPASGSQFLAEAAGSNDVTLQLYPGLRHELVNEVERDQVIALLRDWLLKRA